MAQKELLRDKKRFKMALNEKVKECKKFGWIGYAQISIVDKHTEQLLLTTTFDPKRSSFRKEIERIERIGSMYLKMKHSGGFNHMIKLTLGEIKDGSVYYQQLNYNNVMGVSPLDWRVYVALTDEERYGQPGGKNFKAVCQDYNRMFANDSFEIEEDTMPRDIPPALKSLVKDGLIKLVESGIVVRSITGAFFDKKLFRQIMREQGISFLPKVSK